MKNSEPVLMSKNAYAKYLGIDEKAIRNAIGAGKIVKGWDAEKKKIIQDLADTEFGFSHKLPKARAGVNKAATAAKVDKPKPEKKTPKNSENPKKPNSESPNNENTPPANYDGLTVAEVIAQIVIHPDLSYQQSLQRTAVLQLCTDRIKLSELEGSLVRKDAIDKALYAYGQQIKRGFLAIPARTIDAILAADTKVEAINILTAEINATLANLSSYQNLTLLDK